MKLFVFLLLFCSCAWAQTSVVFLNPGKSNESFWHDVDSFAGAVAGGHFATVGWAFAMIKQHSVGELLAKKIDALLFMLLKANSFTFQFIKDKNWQQLDFSNLSFDFAHPSGFIQ